jgi:hypothetical protein
MKSSAFYAIIGLGVLIVAGIIWFGIYHKHPPVASVPVPANRTATSTSLSGLSIYTNGAYGFSLFYPGQDTATTSFDAQYHLPTTWRVNPANIEADASGMPIIAIVGYHTTSDNSYPRYFETEVRVGASNDPKEVSACLRPGNGETALPDMAINGVDWKAFTLEDDGMMQYLSGTSYRTIHDGQCFALEQIETGSSYRDDPPSAADISDAVLKQHYQDLSSVVQSFAFVRS